MDPCFDMAVSPTGTETLKCGKTGQNLKMINVVGLFFLWKKAPSGDIPNLDSRALLRMTAREKRTLGNPGAGVFLIGFREEQRTRTWLFHSNEKFT